MPDPVTLTAEERQKFAAWLRNQAELLRCDADQKHVLAQPFHNDLAWWTEQLADKMEPRP